MVRVWTDWTEDDTEADALSTFIPDKFAALRSGFIGAGAPAEMVAGQRYCDSAGAGYAYLRNEANDASLRLCGSFRGPAERATPVPLGTVSATSTFIVLVVGAPITLTGVVLVPTTGTTSDGSKHVQVDIYNVTQSLSLRTALFTSNGSEFAAKTVKRIAAQQNATLQADDVIEVRFTYTGAPGSLGAVLAVPEFYDP